MSIYSSVWLNVAYCSMEIDSSWHCIQLLNVVSSSWYDQNAIALFFLGNCYYCHAALGNWNAVLFALCNLDLVCLLKDVAVCQHPLVGCGIVWNFDLQDVNGKISYSSGCILSQVQVVSPTLNNYSTAHVFVQNIASWLKRSIALKMTSVICWMSGLL